MYPTEVNNRNGNKNLKTYKNNLINFVCLPTSTLTIFGINNFINFRQYMLLFLIIVIDFMKIHCNSVWYISRDSDIKVVLVLN